MKLLSIKLCSWFHSHVKVEYPLKQGLKPADADIPFQKTLPAVKVEYPLKQGLKLKKKGSDSLWRLS